MADLDLVEKLRERAAVTYDEAKEALDSCGDDLLEAVIYLEKQGKVPPPTGGSYTSRPSNANNVKYESNKNTGKNSAGFSQHVKWFFSKLGEITKKSCEDSFEVWRYDRVVLTIPVIALILLLFFLFWTVLPIMVIGLFFDCRYKFKARNSEKQDKDINSIIDSVADAAEKMKNDFKNTYGENSDNS